MIIGVVLRHSRSIDDKKNFNALNRHQGDHRYRIFHDESFKL